MQLSLLEEKYICSDSQLQEIHSALIDEYKAVSKKQIEQKITLNNGIFQQKLSNKARCSRSAPTLTAFLIAVSIAQAAIL